MEDLENLAKFSKSRTLKNLAVISCSFVLLFTGFESLSELQSTLNQEQGTLSQALVYTFFGLSALLLPKYAIRKIGCKCSILLSELCYVPWIAANFYPPALVPAAVLNGIAAATLWSGQCTYFNKAAIVYCARPRATFKESTKSNVSLEPLSVRNSVVSLDSKREYGSADGGSVESSGTFCNVNLAFETNVVQEQRPVSTTKNEVLQGFADHESINARFFGCFYLLFKTAGIWGNLLSFLVLKKQDEGGLTNVSLCSCGAPFCNGRTSSPCLARSIGDISDERRFLLSGLCVLFALSALLLLVFGLDQIETGSDEQVSFSADMLLATWNQCKKKEQLLLVPLTTMQGLAQGFYTADFTKAYIGCAWGTYHIGAVTMGYAASFALVSSASGWLIKHVGRIPVFSLGIVTVQGTCVVLLTWSPNAGESYVFYIVAVLWGLMMGTLMSQLPAFYGALFEEDQEAAFASFYVWESVGYTIAFVNSIYLCVRVNIYVLMFVGALGFVGYLVTERRFALKKNEMNSR